MKTLLHSLPLALLAALAVLPFTSGTLPEAQQVDEQSFSDSVDSQGVCSRCGDGYCAKQCGETAASCPRDCGTPG